MPHKPRLARSIRTFIRSEKARIRKDIQDPKEQEAKIQELIKLYLK